MFCASFDRRVGAIAFSAVVLSALAQTACGGAGDEGCDFADVGSIELRTCAVGSPCVLTFGDDGVDVALAVDPSTPLPDGFSVDGGVIRGTGTGPSTTSITLAVTQTKSGCDEVTDETTLLLDIKDADCVDDDDCRVRIAGAGFDCEADDDCNDGALCVIGYERGACIASTSTCQTGASSFTATSTDGVEVTACAPTATSCDAGLCSFL